MYVTHHSTEFFMNLCYHRLMLRSNRLCGSSPTQPEADCTSQGSAGTSRTHSQLQNPTPFSLRCRTVFELCGHILSNPICAYFSTSSFYALSYNADQKHPIIRKNTPHFYQTAQFCQTNYHKIWHTLGADLNILASCCKLGKPANSRLPVELGTSDTRHAFRPCLRNAFCESCSIAITLTSARKYVPCYQF